MLQKDLYTSMKVNLLWQSKWQYFMGFLFVFRKYKVSSINWKAESQTNPQTIENRKKSYSSKIKPEKQYPTPQITISVSLIMDTFIARFFQIYVSRKVLWYLKRY